MARMLVAMAMTALVASGCSCEGPPGRPPTPSPARGRPPQSLKVPVQAPKIGPEVPAIRVKLGDDVPCVAVAVAGPWRLTGDAGVVASGDVLDWTQVTAVKGQVVFGSTATVAGAVELHSDREAGVWIRQTAGGAARERGYRGRILLAPTSKGLLRAVNVLPLEAYVAGVVANELLKSWHVEAYKAQAVAARTYGLMEKNQNARYDFDVFDTTMDQVYGGCDTETRKSWEAVRGTWGIVAAYRGAGGKPVLLKTYYHAACGGETAAAGSVFGGSTPPPLAGGIECTYCRKCPKYRWPPVTLSKQGIGDALRRSGTPELQRLGRLRAVEVAERTSSGGRAGQVRVIDVAGKAVLLRASWWRLLMGAGRVPSTWFDTEDRPDRIVLTGGRGLGHGVGLCQWGTEYLAERGKTAEEVLRYYYPGVELTRAY